MEHILNEIERALDAGLYIVALQSTLTLPGICAALESDNGFNDNNDKATYIDWYDKNVKPYVDWYFTSYDCYRYRCSLVHQASGFIREHKQPKPYGRFISVYPNNCFKMYNCAFKNIGIENNNAYAIDIPEFCRKMIFCVRQWEEQIKDTENFKNNYKNLLNVHPNGIPGFVEGIKMVG